MARTSRNSTGISMRCRPMPIFGCCTNTHNARFLMSKFERRDVAAVGMSRSSVFSIWALSTDTGYFDVFIEYAKADEYDILLRIEVHNRGTEDADSAPATHAMVQE